LTDLLLDSPIGHLFTDNANFYGLTEEENTLRIGKVLHKTFIEINEKGAEAAAATAIIVDVGISEDFIEPVTLNVNRPFLFTIYDAETKVILFIGHVVNPTL
jgi:serpin B